MDARRPCRVPTEPVHELKPVQQFDHVRRRGRLWAVAQPGEPGFSDNRVDIEQADEAQLFRVSQAFRQRAEGGAPRAGARSQPDPLQNF